MRLPRFLLFGGFCAALNNALVIGLVWAGLHPLVASLLAFFPVLVAGFALHSLLTFQTAMSKAAFLRYALAMATNFPAWSASLFILSDLLGAPIAFAAPATTALLITWNFLTARWALTKKPKPVADPLSPEKSR
jgi:putative flippase GtrA